jgi:hypothetical protein
MIDKLAEPNLTKRLDLLANARCDDPKVRKHLIEAKVEISHQGQKPNCWQCYLYGPPHRVGPPAALMAITAARSPACALTSRGRKNAMPLAPAS